MGTSQGAGEVEGRRSPDGKGGRRGATKGSRVTGKGQPWASTVSLVLSAMI